TQDLLQYNYFVTNGVVSPFKHKFTDNDQYGSFKASPFVNDEMNRMVKVCLENTQVGLDDIPDFLTISYYAGNFEHRSIMERPMEMQDMYIRLDRTLKDLLDILEEKVGLDKTLVVLTSSGKEEKLDVDLSMLKVPQGTFYMNRTSALLNMYFMATYGEGRYVDATFKDQIYLNHKQFEEKQIDLADAMGKARDFLLQCSGVQNVVTSHQLLTGVSNSALTLLRNSYNLKCSGDICVELIPGWKLVNEEVHDFYRDYTPLMDFPLYFMGFQVANEQIHTPITVDAIAPTLARIMRIRAPNACTSAPLKGVCR
ncbi:MAG: alkaline phosphatase family protein, partial [Bacteroidaceae bacterium]|nr:alkaline phosphatase family protein [Bacteroidaceae bacterium]